MIMMAYAVSEILEPESNDQFVSFLAVYSYFHNDSFVLILLVYGLPQRRSFFKTVVIKCLHAAGFSLPTATASKVAPVVKIA